MARVTPSDPDLSWRSIPHKDQLAVLCLARLSEPITRASFSTYIFYQLQSLDPSLSSAEIVQQASWMQTALTGMVAIVSLPISRLADSPAFGRKRVLLWSLGVLGASTLCFGFVRNFQQALVLRIIEGTFNGGTIIVRTMIPELVPLKEQRVKAFLILPLSFNVGALLGPPVAGFLISYAQRHASEDAFLAQWTYAPPMLLAGSLIYFAFFAVFFMLEETLPSLRGQPDLGLRMKQAVANIWQGRTSRGAYKQPCEESMPLRQSEDTDDQEESHDHDVQNGGGEASSNRSQQLGTRFPLRRALTPNVLLATSCQAILDGTTTGYNVLWPLFLSDPPLPDRQGLHYSGGAGLGPSQIALTLSILAVGALPLQVFVYPRVSHKLKPLGTFRWFSWCAPLAYSLAPLIAVTVDTPVLMWGVIVTVQVLMVLTSAMVVPSAMLLTNNSAPHPAALSTTHGLAVTLSAVSRTISPIAAGAAYTYGQEHHIGGLAWWLMAGTATCVCILSWFMYNGSDTEVR